MADAIASALRELVAAITDPDAFPLETEETPFGESHRLVENPRITAALLAARAALTDSRTGASAPRRAYELTLCISADTWDNAVAEMRRVVEHVEEHGPGCNSISGGSSTGHIVEIEHRPEMTAGRYREELRAWSERQRESARPKLTAERARAILREYPDADLSAFDVDGDPDAIAAEEAAKSIATIAEKVGADRG